MERRGFLALSGTGLASLAGCSSSDSDPDESGAGSGGGDPTDTATPEATATSTPTPTPEPMTVDGVTMAGLQPARIELGTPDSIGVFGESDGQSLFLSVTVGDENPPERSDFEFELDGTTVAPVSETRSLWRRSEPEFGEEYSSSGGGWLLFELPATVESSDAVRLRWPGGSWQPPEPVRHRLASPNPAFDVSVTAPDTIPVDETPEVTVTFENTSSVSGTFLMAVNRVGPYVGYTPETTVRQLLDPGESDTATITPSFFDRDEIQVGDTTELKFDWYGGQTDREIEFVAGSD